MADASPPSFAAADNAAAPDPTSQAAGAPAGFAPAELELRDIHLPAEPHSWPPAPGWWLLLALIITAAAAVAVLGWRHWRRARRRRRILSELDRIGAERTGSTLVAGVAALLKRSALMTHPDADVAALTGDAWLGFLDRTGGEGRFSDGPGRVLAAGPYAPTTEGLDDQALLALARRWLRKNLG
jgi:hypothetical protein